MTTKSSPLADRVNSHAENVAPHAGTFTSVVRDTGVSALWVSPLNPLIQQCCDVRGVSAGVLSRTSMMPRETSLSDKCMSDGRRFNGPHQTYNTFSPDYEQTALLFVICLAHWWPGRKLSRFPNHICIHFVSAVFEIFITILKYNIRVHAQISESKILTFPDFILTKKPVFPDFQKPIKWPGDWIWH